MTKFAAIDIETKPGVGHEEYTDAALDHHRNAISIYAISGDAVGTDGRFASRDVAQLANYADYDFVTHGGRFDFKTLLAKGAPVTLEQYTDDTMLMAVAYSKKVPGEWLEQYEEARRLKNKEYGKSIHRNAGGYSLKTLAPYFLGVEPFWEVEDHDNLEYVTKDTDYTLELYHFLKAELEAEGSYDFYKECLMPWQKMLLAAELRGVTIDFDLMSKKEIDVQGVAAAAEAELRNVWAEAFTAYELKQHEELRQEYEAKKAAAIAKLTPSKKKTPEKAALENAEKYSRTFTRYEEMLEKAVQKIEPLNLGSPVQLAWLLKEQLQLDITTFRGDEESTGKKVLQRLADTGRDDVATFLKYREAEKLLNAFFPSYREKAVNSVIHTNFNLTGARTGRLSSNGPNLQQVPGHLHELFVARPGHKLICYDLSNIEPLLIAYLTECPELCALMIQGRSFHDKNVEIGFGIEKVDKKLHKKERDCVKEVGLSLLYGAGWRRVEESVAKRGFNWKPRQCQEFTRNFRDYYQNVYDFKAKLDKQLEAGELVRNLFGRPIICEDKSKIFLTGFNTAVQGSASDLLLESAHRALTKAKEEGIDMHLLLVVHDELIIEVKEEDAERGNEITKEALTSWELPTPYGIIKTQCEGGISDFWSK